MTENKKRKEEIFHDEETFHDDWANSTKVEDIDVINICESSTSPELRYITNALGNIEGKSVLDVGSGLGEVSVYFALKGAKVTAVDISQEMLNFSNKLATKYGTTINTIYSTTEDLEKHLDTKFDIIYAGNLLHHVDIEKTVEILKRHLKPEGIFISWDPIKYNPIINIYRKMATKVRTEDETPLGIKDVAMIKRKFNSVKTEFFWLSSLWIFIAMYLFQRKDPNKERYWKVVVAEGAKWKNLFNVLNAIDKTLITALPPLKWLCWNVVIKASNPVRDS